MESTEEKQPIIDGSLYKIGAHGKVFSFTGDDWVKSEKTHEEFLKHVELMK